MACLNVTLPTLFVLGIEIKEEVICNGAHS
jgi:hypothetical protein